MTPGLRRQGQVFDDPFLVGHLGHPFGHADAEIDDAVGLQLEGRPAGDDLAFVQRQRRNGMQRDLDLAAEGRVVAHRRRSASGFRAGDDDAIDQDAGDLDVAGPAGFPAPRSAPPGR